MAFYTDAFAHKGTFMHRIAAVWDAYKADADKRAAYRTTLRELSGLSDRELADLGLHRSNIKSVAMQAAGRA